MNILLTLYQNSIMYCKTMLLSLFEHSNVQLNIFIFHSNLNEKEINEITKFIKSYHNNVNIIKIDNHYFQNAPLYRGCTKEIYYRLLAMDKLPNTIERVLYLDIDIIINNNIEGFYNMDFNENYFIVCEDKNHSKKNIELYNILGIPQDAKYFNSGVLLFNLSLLRKNKQSKSIQEFMQSDWKEKNKWFHDQNVLNSLYYDKVKYSDYQIYNCFIKNIPREKRPFYLENSCIFHFAGLKPWKYKYPNECYKIWWKYAIKADYKKEFLKFIIKNKIYFFLNPSKIYNPR